MKFATAATVTLLALSTVDALNVKKLFRFGKTSLPKDSSPKPAAKGGYDLDVSELFDGNNKFIADKLAGDPAYFDTLGTVHSPKYLYIGRFCFRNDEVQDNDEGQSNLFSLLLIFMMWEVGPFSSDLHRSMALTRYLLLALLLVVALSFVYSRLRRCSRSPKHDHGHGSRYHVDGPQHRQHGRQQRLGRHVGYSIRYQRT
jgi:hypothetical protein